MEGYKVKVLKTTEKEKERAILIAVDSEHPKNNWSLKASIDEATSLASSVGAEIVGKLIQKLPAPSKVSYFGKGKLNELLELKERLNYDTVIVDDELTPQQQEYLQEFLKSRVVDRISLILDIFAKRARTHEGKLQVELAQYEYNLPRLAGKWKHLERLGAGIGTRGPGESQLETDRRIIRQKITRLKKQLEEIRRARAMHRQKRTRSGIPVIALVGYTNTGKSTLLNAISHAEVLAKNELFSTLDPTTRRLILPDRRVVLLSDTVGFIRRLPTSVITAFRATLEELKEASVLVHVVDITAHNAVEQSETVEEILKELEIQNKPRITVLNKIDLLLPGEQKWEEDRAIDYISQKCGEPGIRTVLISAEKKWGFKRLLELIAQVIDEKKLQNEPNEWE